MTDWDRTARLAAAALVRSEARTLRGARAAVLSVTERVAGRLAAVPGGGRAAADQAVRVVRDAVPEVAAALASAVADGRDGAKEASLERLEVEWLFLLRLLRSSGFEADERLLRPVDAAPENEVEANLAAQSYSAAWGAAMLTAVWAWQESGNGALASAATNTTRALDYRLRRIAATETTKAFADARTVATDAVAERYGTAPWWSSVLRVWDATLDSRVCATCAELDGVERPWGVPFPDGAEPGYVHANCRCIVVTRVRGLEQRSVRTPSIAATVGATAALAALAAMPGYYGVNLQVATPFRANPDGDWMAATSQWLTPEEQRALDDEKLQARLPIKTVRLTDLTAGQEVVQREGVRSMVESFDRKSGDLPIVAKLPDGRLMILDGHHRLTAQMLLGQEGARVRFLDLSARQHRKAN